MSDTRQHEAGQHGATLHRVGSGVVIALAGDIDLIAETDVRTALDDALALLSADPCTTSSGTRPGPADLHGASARSRPDASAPHTTSARNAAGTDAGGLSHGGGPPVLVMDLSAVSFFSSTGLQLLVTADRAAASQGVVLRVATGTHRSVLRTLHLTGLDTMLSLFTTREDAVAGSSPRLSG